MPISLIKLTMKLSFVKCGKQVTVTGSGSDGKFNRRLISLGLCTGARIRVVKLLPLSRSIVVEANGFLYALREEAAELIEVTDDE